MSKVINKNTRKSNKVNSLFIRLSLSLSLFIYLTLSLYLFLIEKNKAFDYLQHNI